MYHISQLAQQFGLSRSTLLYYDRIGLLSPSARSEAGYRQYSPANLKFFLKIVKSSATTMGYHHKL